MSWKYEYKKYKVVEEYLGEKIVVNVNECWNDDGIEHADIFCPKYGVIMRGLGHSIGNYKLSNAGIVQGEIIKLLSVDDVHDAIFKEIQFAEESIAESKNEKHDMFKSMRHLTILVDYDNQEIPVEVVLKAGDTQVEIICIDTRLNRIPIDSIRDKIVEEVHKGKRMIDDGYVFSTLGTFGKIKRKIKNYFTY